MRVIKSARLLRSLLFAAILIAVVPYCPVDSQNQFVYLTRLAISSGTLVPRFRPDVTDYAVAIAPSVRELFVTVNAGHGAPSIRARANAGEWIAVRQGRPSPALSLNIGNNSIEIEVVAEGLNTSTYTISVERAAPGSIDAGFDTGSIRTRVALGGAWPLALQSDGKILVGGDFSRYGDYSRFNIARLNTNGLVDQSFNAGASIGSLAAIALQSDQKILIAGWFDSHSGVARLNPDGSLNAGFQPGTGVNGNVKAIAVQPDGRIVIGGTFDTFNGSPRSGIARLNADGSLDAGFDPGRGLESTFTAEPAGIRAIALQADGKLIVGGYFTAYDGTARSDLARLNTDGSVDADFDPGNVAGSANPEFVDALAIQADGKVLVGGHFWLNYALPNIVSRVWGD